MSQNRCALAQRRPGQVSSGLGAALAAPSSGTDAGGMNDYDPSDEYLPLAEASMTFREIPAALTTTLRLRTFERSPTCATR